MTRWPRSRVVLGDAKADSCFGNGANRSGIRAVDAAARGSCGDARGFATRVLNRRDSWQTLQGPVWMVVNSLRAVSAGVHSKPQASRSRSGRLCLGGVTVYSLEMRPCRWAEVRDFHACTRGL